MVAIDFSCQDLTDELCASARELVSKARIAIVGMGALGAAAAHALVRSGCEDIVIIDDDVVEERNLPRQSLFFEEDVGREKVVVAGERLRMVNAKAMVVPIVSRLTDDNVAYLLCKADLVLGCTDDLESRRVIDDYCKDKPWVHAAVIGGRGEVMAVLPGSKRYAEVIHGKRPDESCSRQGVLSVAAIMTGTLQAIVALRVLAQQEGEVRNRLFRFDAWKIAVDSFFLG